VAISPSAPLAFVNRLPCWRVPMRAWGFSLTPPTLDRAVYLWLHGRGRLGRGEQAFFTREIGRGMHVADVGANIGLYTLLFARLTGPDGRVYAFEPDALMAGALRRNLAANHMSHVDVFDCAVAAHSGHATLLRHALHSGDNYLGDRTSFAHAEQHVVDVRTLDDVLAGRKVDFIKIDVQGWEGAVIEGTGRVFDANPGLTICFEFWPRGLARAGSSIARLTTVLEDLRLRLARVTDDGRLQRTDLADLSSMLGSGGFVNVLARR
jgi:FkbM family methyltransferase